ncbi:ArdC family protein [Yersinia wautersii]|uniref:Antirestriction protein n=1 Tax=Yersinia wautersii TaxID=1341643 RepID=A0ABM9THH9_9GAMM|nr:zincin-like metallopeptidase domain-containing protein [Yersinia wautersii]CRG50897.1 antirestriction protein [Yersinia wautersii]
MKKSTSCRKAHKRADLYQQVTDKIIVALEKGTIPWRKPWRSVRKPEGSSLPTNALTGRPYQGVNIPLLWMAGEERGFGSDRWLTYRQAQKAGGQVRKGESCSLAVIFKPFEKQAEDEQGNKLFDGAGKPLMKRCSMMKSLQLFNTDQCEGLPELMATQPVQLMVQDEIEILSAPLMNRVVEILNHSGVKTTPRRQNRAFCRPLTDEIIMPLVGQFFTEADYWSTLLHELIHASGHQKRLNREGITSSTRTFGDPIYAFEELIAELGSAFLCAELGIYGEVQHESYISGWLKRLRKDKKALFRACRQARQASEFLLTQQIGNDG